MDERQNNPWVPREDNKGSILSAIQILLMGYGAFCVARNLYLFAKRKFSKELPVHEDM